MPTPRKKVADVDDERAKDTVPPANGLYTTEFILSAVALIISGLMVIISQNLSAQEWLDYSKWIVGGYAVARGIAKVGAPR